MLASRDDHDLVEIQARTYKHLSNSTFIRYPSNTRGYLDRPPSGTRTTISAYACTHGVADRRLSVVDKFSLPPWSFRSPPHLPRGHQMWWWRRVLSDRVAAGR